MTMQVLGTSAALPANDVKVGGFSSDGRYVFAMDDDVAASWDIDDPTTIVLADSIAPTTYGSMGGFLNETAFDGRYMFWFGGGNTGYKAVMWVDTDDPLSLVSGSPFGGSWGSGNVLTLPMVAPGMLAVCTFPNGSTVSSMYRFDTDPLASETTSVPLEHNAAMRRVGVVDIGSAYFYTVSYGASFETRDTTTLAQVATAGPGIDTTGPRAMSRSDDGSLVWVSGAQTWQLYDVTNPAIPVHLSSEARGTTQYGGVFASDGYLYTLEYGNVGGTNYLFVHKWDIDDPTTPALVETLQWARTSSEPRMAIHGDHLAVTTGSRLVVVGIDIELAIIGSWGWGGVL